MLALDDTTELLHLFGDPTRLRLLALLERFELSVGELTAATQLTQSRVSTHLAKLRDAGLLTDRRIATSTLYRVNQGAIPPPHRRLWELLKQDLRDSQLAMDALHAQEVIAARVEQARWPEHLAGEMERHYSPGRTWEAACRGFSALVSPGRVLDVGSGDGAISELLLPAAESLVCLDHSPRLCAAAASRLAQYSSARAVVGDMHALPLPDASCDTVLLWNALTCATDPTRALAEAARVLAPGGRLSIVTLDAHEHAALTATYGHRTPGFAPSVLHEMLIEAGLGVGACQVTSQERKSPHFKVVSVLGFKPTQ